MWRQLVAELQRELKHLRKTSDHQTSQIDDASAKLRSKMKLDEEVAKLGQEIVLLKETSSVQVNIIYFKRQFSEKTAY